MLNHGGGSADDFARIDIVSNHTVFRDPALFRALMQGHALPILDVLQLHPRGDAPLVLHILRSAPR